ncbi:MAG: hypothetical protein ACFFG0_00690 [Candidatus Thorarchaeota archaeon]
MVIISDTRSIYVGEYPCAKCLVQASCENFVCSMLEKYLNKYHKFKGIATADELRYFDKHAPAQLKEIMNKLEKHHKDKEYDWKYRTRSYLYSKNNKIFEISLFKGEIKIIEKRYLVGMNVKSSRIAK